jgi:hypothetical protein
MLPACAFRLGGIAMLPTELPDEEALGHSGTGSVLVAMLRQGRHVDRLSMILLLAAVVLLCAGMLNTAAAWRSAWAVCLWLSIACALVQRYYALRVRIDEDLFGHLYAQPFVEADALRRMDAGLAMTSGKPPRERPLRDRWAGALRLWRRQIQCCVIQAGFLLAAGVAAWLH